ncbi:GDSL-type esterase/lipase family protein [Blastococcus sp. LR1]|uniref:GDSL-type esterase/lipase family protein n=1 Tax=Blastococcus sp. LR1 TaxID=2877000 RepID=UPI001CCE0ACF|nr:GDSL-type esterase/lipase family protein [Blastococcus sp. LR1]MCA0143595.1 GDSL-type esterase/lipase family protein [Blastococcus sp. LR1]
MRDLRVCFVGDSFVAGVGDPEHRGWVGRLCARSADAGRPLTAYNLGVRRETSADVLARWHAECSPRLALGEDRRVVISLGVNDTTVDDTSVEFGGVRVAPDSSVAALSALLDGVAGEGWSALVVGPPPIADADQNRRIGALDLRFAELCAARDAPYVSVFGSLAECPVWCREVATGDGAHPGAAGYQRLADVVWPAWSAWTETHR